jgi:hypothetical protein
MGLAGGAQGARKRRCGDIVDDEQRSDHPAIPMRPVGSGRRGGICCVGAPRRCPHIACVAPPCICPRGARNAAPPNSRTGS